MIGIPAFAPAQKREGSRKAPRMGRPCGNFPFAFVLSLTAYPLPPPPQKKFLRWGLTGTDVCIITRLRQLNKGKKPETLME